jgi:hypothetical protein
MRHALALTTLATVATLATVEAASARSCSELQSLCWTMRSNKNDCSAPYQRCLKTGVFVTPLGRVFKATSR